MKRALFRLYLAGLILAILATCAGAQVRSGIVISTRANLRETPSQTAQVKQEVPVGSEIKILDQKGAWYVVRLADAVGWMHGNTFRFGDQSAATDAGPPTRSRATSNDSSATVTTSPTRARPESQPATSIESTVTPGSSKGYIRGPRGGCYYYGRSGRKVYVDRSLCN